MDDVKVRNAQEALDAVKENGRRLQHIPAQFITAEIIDICLKHGEKDGYTLLLALKLAPEEIITKRLIDLCIEAVEKDYRNNKAKNFKDHIGGGIPDKELLKHAKFIPQSLWTAALAKIFLDVLKVDGLMLSFMQPYQLTAEMCIAAIKHKPEALEYVPNEYKTAKMCIEALKQNYTKMIKFIPAALMAPELEDYCVERMQKNKSSLNSIPEELRTERICLEAVKMKDENFRDVPGHLKAVPAIFKEALKKNSKRIFTSVPDEHKTAEMCMEAVNLDGMLFRLVPEHLQTKELFEFAKSKGYVGRWKGEADVNAVSAEESAKAKEAAKAENVAKMQAGGMGTYVSMMVTQLKNMPPETRETVIKTLPADIQTQVRQAIG